MTTTTAVEQEEERLYDELRRLLEDVEETDRRKRVLNRMIKQLRIAKWRKERLGKFDEYCKSIRPATLWIMLATGALAPAVLFSIFIWVSLWVE